MKILPHGMTVVLEDEEEVRHFKNMVYACYTLSNRSVREGVVSAILVSAGVGPDLQDLRKFNEFVSRLADFD